MSSELTHIGADGNPKMVDVGAKAVTLRSATARCFVLLPGQLSELLQDGDIQTKKGPVFQTAILAGVMGAKRTSDLIPLCHPLSLEDCQVSVKFVGEAKVEVSCTVRLHGKTGVEMEALTGASVAALTIYDMCKAISHDIAITDLCVIAKSGGKHDFNKETS
jgi:cyclic pyranopterin phosphate synthase